MKTAFTAPRMIFFLVAISAALLTGCSSKQAMPDASGVNASERAALPAADVAILEASDLLANARNAQLDIYSPRNTQRAADALASAQKLRARNRPDAEVLTQTNAVGIFVKSAQDNKALAERTLPEAIAHRKVLEEIGTPIHLPREYVKSTSMFRNLAETLETGNTGKALKEQGKVLGEFMKIEIATLKAIHLAPAEAMLGKAKDINAHDVAAVTYKEADRSVKAAERFMETTPRDRSGVKAVGTEALLAAQKTFNVATEAQQLIGLDKRKAEQRALHYFSLMARINQSGRVANLASMGLYEQSVALGYQLELAGRAVVSQTPPVVPSITPASALAAAAVNVEEAGQGFVPDEPAIEGSLDSEPDSASQPESDDAADIDPPAETTPGQNP